MPTYRLHYFPESGNSYKLALMLTLCGETFEPVWTDFGGGVTRTAEWRATVNPMGEIPVLEEDGVRFTQTAPILLRLLLKSMGATAGGDLSQLRSRIPAPDYDAFESPGRYEAFGYALRESLRQGTKGPAWDMRLYVHPLDIRLQDIQIPLHLFHGAKDTNVPIALVRDMLAVLPTAKLVAYPHDAHLSTLCEHFDDIARVLVGG